MDKLKVFFEYNPWKKTVLLIPTYLILYVAYGNVLSASQFDEIFLTYLKLINVNSPLDVSFIYVSVLMAILIPVFIILLEFMSKEGDLNKKALPNIVEHRELITSFIFLSLLILVAPRASFLYFPIAIITAHAFYAFFITIRVVYEDSRVFSGVNKYTKEFITRAFKKDLGRREIQNSLFNDLESYSKITHVLTFFDREEISPVKLASNDTGEVVSIDLAKMDKALNKHLGIQGGKLNSQTSSMSKTNEIVVLNVRPGSSVKYGEALATVYLPPESQQHSIELLGKIRKSIKIIGLSPYSHNSLRQEFFDQLHQQFRQSIKLDDVLQTTQNLKIYDLVLDGVKEIGADAEDEYDFDAASREFNQFLGDNFSKNYSELADILVESILYSCRLDKPEASKKFVSYIYGNFFRITNYGYNPLLYALTNYQLTISLQKLVYARPKTPTNMSTFEDICFKLREHTGHSLFIFRERNRADDIPKKELKSLLLSRLNSVRELLLNTLKAEQFDEFKQVLSIAKEIEKSSKYHYEEQKDITDTSRSILFLVGAYANSQKDMSPKYKQFSNHIDEILQNLQSKQITDLFMYCVDNKLHHEWRVDTIDLPADGEMHFVPDFKKQMSKYWADLMLADSFSADVRSYNKNRLAKTFAFTEFRDASSEQKQYILEYLDSIDNEKSDQLKELVENFIGVKHSAEQDSLIAEQLDDQKISDFANKVSTGYEENSIVKALFGGKTQFNTRAKTGFKQLGWNEIRPKEAFIKDWYIGHALLGDDYGQEIARYQNNFIIEKLLANVKTIENKSKWLSRIRKVDDEIVVVANQVPSYKIEQEFGKEIKERQEYTKIVFKRSSQKLPIFHTYSDEIKSGLYALKRDKLGTVKIKNKAGQYVKIDVSAYSHDKQLLDSILSEPPKWLQDKGSKEEYLQDKVRLLVAHIFKYQKAKQPEIFFFPMTEDY